LRTVRARSQRRRTAGAAPWWPRPGLRHGAGARRHDAPARSRAGGARSDRAGEGCGVLGRAVAHVGLPAVAGCRRRGGHQRVPRHLGDDRGRGDREAEPVAAGYRLGAGRAGRQAAGCRRRARSAAACGSAATARTIASRLAPRMFSRSISSTEAAPTPMNALSRSATARASRRFRAAPAWNRSDRQARRRGRGSPLPRRPVRPRDRARPRRCRRPARAPDAPAGASAAPIDGDGVAGGMAIVMLAGVKPFGKPPLGLSGWSACRIGARRRRDGRARCRASALRRHRLPCR
jgi:hypothetical protein